MRDVEINVTPFLKFWIIVGIVRVTGRLQRLMEMDGILGKEVRGRQVRPLKVNGFYI